MRSPLPRAAALLLALAPGVAAAGAWTPPRGEAYGRVWVRRLAGAHAFLPDGGIAATGAPYRDHALGLYAEAGLSDTWALVLQGTPVGRAAVEGGDAAVYTGPLLLGVRRALTTGGLRTAVELRAGGAPPVCDRDLLAPTDPTAGLVYVPTTPSGRLDAELQAGHGLGPAWVVAAAGATAFTAPALDPALSGSLQVGARARFGLSGSLTASTWQPLGEVTIANTSGAGQTRYVGLTTELGWWFEAGWGVAAGAGLAPLAQANAATPAWHLALERKVADLW